MRRLHGVRTRLNHLQGLESAQEYIRLKQERELLYNKLKEIEQELQERENNKTR